MSLRKLLKKRLISTDLLKLRSKIVDSFLKKQLTICDIGRQKKSFELVNIDIIFEKLNLHYVQEYLIKVREEKN